MTHLNFGLAIGVDLGGVEEVDAVVPRSLQTFLDDVALLGTTIGEPSSKGEDGDFKTGRTKVAEHLQAGSVSEDDHVDLWLLTMSLGSNIDSTTGMIAIGMDFGIER